MLVPQTFCQSNIITRSLNEKLFHLSQRMNPCQSLSVQVLPAEMTLSQNEKGNNRCWLWLIKTGSTANFLLSSASGSAIPYESQLPMSTFYCGTITFIWMRSFVTSARKCDIYKDQSSLICKIWKNMTPVHKQNWRNWGEWCTVSS
jgi:hypothetical protein